MVRRVKHAPPEDPDPLAFDVEERDASGPPLDRLGRENAQPRARELGQTVRRRADGERVRYDVRGRRFTQAQELAEEAPL